MNEMFLDPELAIHVKYRGEADDMVIIIAFDPGGTTGWSVFSFWNNCMAPGEKLLPWLHSWSCGEITGPEDHQVDQMIELVEGWPMGADVVVEDFILREFRRGRELLSPVRITAAFAYQLRWLGRPKRGRGREGGATPRRPILQQPSLAMTCITDDRLRNIGLYPPTKGKPHARDAVRHALTWARRKKEGYNFTD
jgi:hypothetical protein